MFLVNPNDQADFDLLRQLFPQGTVSTYQSRVGKNFYIYMVPEASSIPAGAPASSEILHPEAVSL